MLAQWLKISGIGLVVLGALMIAPNFPALNALINYTGGLVMGWAANDLHKFLSKRGEKKNESV